jgi:hypothetical protein
MTEAREEAPMFTRLFPISMAESVSSYRSQFFKAAAARREPVSLAFSRRNRFRELKAISDAEKKAERARNAITAAKYQGEVTAVRPPLLFPADGQ